MIADNRRHLTPKDSRFSIWAVLYLSAEIHRQCKQQGEGNERAGKGGRENSKRPPEKDKKSPRERRGEPWAFRWYGKQFYPFSCCCIE